MAGKSRRSVRRALYRCSPAGRPLFLILVLATALTSCKEKQEAGEPVPRPVRTVTLEKSEAGVPVVLNGHIEALDEAALGFRLSGRMIERKVSVGDRVEAGQVLARLEALNEMNALRAAKAELAAAQAKLTQVSNHFDRQQTLLSQGWTTRANFDQAERELRTAEAQVEAAEAQLKTAHDQVDFTELMADAEGVVTAVGRRAWRGRAGRPDDRQARAAGWARRRVRCPRPSLAYGAERSVSSMYNSPTIRR